MNGFRETGEAFRYSTGSIMETVEGRLDVARGLLGRR